MDKDASGKGRGAAPMPADANGETAPPSADPGHGADTPMMALARLDPPKLELTKLDPAVIESPKIESRTAGSSTIETTNVEPRALDLPNLDGPTMEGICPPTTDSAPRTDSSGEAQPAAYGAGRTHRFPLLAASLVLAAGLGAMVGSLIATGLASRIVRPTAPAVVTAKSGLEEVQALKEQVVQVRVDLAALKASIESGHRHANAQFTKIGERVERIDRTQAEPVAKLTKAIEAFERRETTGSVTPPQPVPGQPPKQSGVVEGWVVRDVQRGTALIESRLGIIEVDAGDIVPGLGRVDAIRKQDGRWVVVTPKGLILPPR